jgi:hypothetical protein
VNLWANYLLLGLCLFLLLRNFIDLILHNHVRVYLVRIIVCSLTDVVKAKLRVSRVSSLNSSGVCSNLIWILAF